MGQVVGLPQSVNDPLYDAVGVFQRWLHLPDPTVVYVAAGTAAANRLDGDPVWVLFVGAPGGGKTEVLEAVSALPEVHAATTITEAALLSGTPLKERADDSSGGLLREIGERGLIVCKDFTSVLSMRHEERASALAALREVYDGSYTRVLGVDGGRSLAWRGKVGLLAGVTPTIDRHHGVMASMGERFVLYRLTPLDPYAQARAALRVAGSERRMRAELANAVSGLFATMAPTARPLNDAETTTLVTLASLEVVAKLALPQQTVTRGLEDLAAHGVVIRDAPGRPKPTTWALAESARDAYEAVS